MRLGLSRSLSLFCRQHGDLLRLGCRGIAAHAQVDSKPRQTIGIPPPPPPARQSIDPHSLVASELSYIRKCFLSLLETSHPGLAESAQYYFLQPSKQVRSLLVLLFARATNGSGQNWDHKDWEAVCETTTGRSAVFDNTLSRSDVLNEWNPSMPDHTASFESVFCLQQPPTRPSYPSLRPPSNLARNLSPRLVCPPSLLPTQIRLAQIVEMVHIASVLHDGIASTIEQGNPSSTTQGHGFGNKMVILGGDLLLGRASWGLSQLGESEVVELIATVISNQVEGQFLRLGQIKTPELGLYPPPDSLSEAWDRYLKGVYLKTASLMAKGARSAVILGGCHESNVLREVAYQYGRHLGIAFQLTKDARQIAQLQPGLATGPLLFASEECPSLLPLIQRNLSKPGDTKLAVECIQTTSGVERTHLLAGAYAEKAREVLDLVPESETKLALHALIDIVVKRT